MSAPALPKLEIEMPGLPDGMQPGQSAIGDEGARHQAWEHFQQMFADAVKPAPVSSHYSAEQIGKGVYDQHAAIHASNPLKPSVETIYKQYAEIQASAGQDKADAYFEGATRRLASRYMEGIDKGKNDTSLSDKQMGAFQQIFSGDFMGGIRTFLTSIPVVSDLIAAAKRWIGAKIQGEELSFADARQQIREEKAYGGVSVALGLNAEGLIGHYDASRSAVANNEPDEKPSIELDHTFDADAIGKFREKGDSDNGLTREEREALQQVNALINGGQITFGENGAVATEAAVQQLDKLPALDGQRQGASWAAGK